MGGWMDRWVGWLENRWVGGYIDGWVDRRVGG